MSYKAKTTWQNTIANDFVSGSNQWTGAEVQTGFLDMSDSVQWLDAEASLTDGATITWDYATGAEKTVTLGGNRTLVINNLPTGRVVYGCLRVIQDSTGGRTLTLPSGEVNGALNSASLSASIITFRYNGSVLSFTIGQYA